MDKMLLNRDWAFAYFADGDGINDWDIQADWQTVSLPHDFSIAQRRLADSRSYRDGGYFPGGFGIYRKTIAVSRAALARTHYILFEGVYQNAQVRLNGNVLGYHPYGYTSFYYELNPFLVEGDNELLVYVDNTTLPSSRWYSGSGIYRSVWLYRASPLHIAPWGVFVRSAQAGGNARLLVDTTVEGSARSCTIEHAVLTKDGKEIARAIANPAQNGGQCVIEIAQPMLWDTDNPYLYTLETRLFVDGVLADTHTTAFGIRYMSVDAKRGFLLNGRPVKLKGGCVHHDNGILGAASFPRSEERKVELLKAGGFNAVRCAHNPPAPAFLDACDRLGMLVIDEAFDVWSRGKKRYDYHTRFFDWWQRDMQSMILRDRNHPSVVMWSIGNEIPEQALPSGRMHAGMLCQYAKSLDDTRPVTLAADNVEEGHDAYFSQVDIAGYNYRYERYEGDHRRRPERVIMGTESLPKNAWENWDQVQRHDYVIGDFVWTALDYLGEAALGRHYYREDAEALANLSAYPWHKAHCGDYDLTGVKRSQSYYRDIMWGVRTKPYIAVRRPAPEGLVTEAMDGWGWNDNLPCWEWPGMEGKALLVDVYAPGDTVSLYLNGRLIGTKSLTNPRPADGEYNEASEPRARFAALFSVPYAPGELTAVTDTGERWSISTPKGEKMLALAADRHTIGTDDLCYISLFVVDAQGIPFADANDTIVFAVEGAGELIAIGSGNPCDEEPYQGLVHTAWQGRLLAVIHSNGAGVIRISAKDGGMRESAIEITAADTL